MSKRIRTLGVIKRAYIAGFFAIATPVTTLCLSWSPSALAQEGEAVRQFGSAAGQIVNAAQDLAASGQFSGAISKLGEAIALPDLTPFERSTTYSILAQYKFEMDDMPGAISAFENAIKAGGLSSKESSDFERQIALLHIRNEQYVMGAAKLESWAQKTGARDPKTTEYIMQAWIQAERYQKALPWAEKWFSAAAPKERRHFDLMNFLLHNSNLNGRQADLIKQMIMRWPDDRSLWDSWISLLAQDGREKDAFEVNKMLYLSGNLTSESEIKKIVEYYQYYEMPFQAGQIMEKEMNAGRIQVNASNLVRLSELFRQAREYERALPILEKAAQASKTGKSWARYGEALYNEGQCESAETVLKTSMDLGYDRGKSWMFVANCWYERGQTEKRPVCHRGVVVDRDGNKKIKLNEQALASFRKVPTSAKTYGAAQKWIDFVTTENKSFDNRCEEEWNILIDLCMMKIESGYKMSIITGKFELAEEDQHCMEFKDMYDKKYRRSL